MFKWKVTTCLKSSENEGGGGGGSGVVGAAAVATKGLRVIVVGVGLRVFDARIFV